MSEVSNPFQAVNETFIRPNKVFAKLANTDNWSWVPFFIVMALALLPLYLFFQTIDFAWYSNYLADVQLGDVSPAEKQAYKDQLTLGMIKWSTLIGSFLGFLIINALVAGYLTFMTRNDEKSIQGFTDWYGMTWWTALPSIIPSLIALVLLVMADSHQIDPISLSPLWLAYIFGLEPTSAFFSLGQSIRLDMFWSYYLTAVALGQWTSFSTKKSWIVALAPGAVIYGIWLIFAIV